MYKRFVANKVHSTFAAISRGDVNPMLRGLAPQFRYRFVGDHALGGTRTTQASMRRWWDRVFELVPAARFDVQDIVVAGAPWSTRVGTRVRIQSTDTAMPYENEFMQIMRIRWGRVVDIVTIEDTAALGRFLDERAAAGITAAHAPPINDLVDEPAALTAR